MLSFKENILVFWNQPKNIALNIFKSCFSVPKKNQTVPKNA